MLVFEYFVTYFLPIMIFAFGFVGNLLGFIIFTNKKLNLIGPRIIFKSLFVMDTCMMVFIWQPYLGFGFNKDLTLISDSVCHIYWYLNYSIAPISPILLCYISIERVASIVYSKRILKSKNFQIITLAIIVFYNLFYHIEVLLWYQIIPVKAVNYSTNLTSEIDNSTLLSCNFKDMNAQNIISFMDLMNRVLIPLTLMMLTTVWLIYKIAISRIRIISSYNSKHSKAFNKQMKFSATIISLNIIYLFLSLPLSVEVFLPQYNSNAYFVIYLTATYMFYMGYAINFYIVFASNKLARKQFFLFLKSIKR